MYLSHKHFVNHCLPSVLAQCARAPSKCDEYCACSKRELIMATASVLPKPPIRHDNTSLIEAITVLSRKKNKSTNNLASPLVWLSN